MSWYQKGKTTYLVVEVLMTECP